MKKQYQLPKQIIVGKLQMSTSKRERERERERENIKETPYVSHNTQMLPHMKSFTFLFVW